MLVAEDIVVALGRSRIIGNVSLAVAPATLTVIVGPNGAGKTTFVRALTGELAPVSGCVLLDGVPLDQWPGAELARRRAVLPQASHLAFPFTVFEVVAMGGGMGRDPRRPLEALARVGMAGYEARYYQALSGGEQQRVQLARVLCQIEGPGDEKAPRWLFLDEPTSNLDIRHQIAILDIARAHARAGGGVVAILHDLNMASLYADRLIVMSGGTVAADGPPAEVLTDDLMRSVFAVGLRVNHVPASGAPFVLPHSVV